MSKPVRTQEAHLSSRLELHKELLEQKSAHIEELSNTIVQLRDKNDVLQRERDGWKRSSGREGIYGFTLGAIIFLVVGVFI